MFTCELLVSLRESNVLHVKSITRIGWKHGHIPIIQKALCVISGTERDCMYDGQWSHQSLEFEGEYGTTKAPFTQDCCDLVAWHLRAEQVCRRLMETWCALHLSTFPQKLSCIITHNFNRLKSVTKKMATVVREPATDSTWKAQKSHWGIGHLSINSGTHIPLNSHLGGHTYWTGWCFWRVTCCIWPVQRVWPWGSCVSCG